MVNAVLDAIARDVRGGELDKKVRRTGEAPGSCDVAVRSEDDLIARYFAPLAGEGALGLRDDAARLSPRPGHDLVLTTDALVERCTSFPDDLADSIARKALGVNVSDLAAKGAEPRGFLLDLALPEDWTEDWLAGLRRRPREGGGNSPARSWAAIR